MIESVKMVESSVFYLLQSTFMSIILYKQINFKKKFMENLPKLALGTWIVYRIISRCHEDRTFYFFYLYDCINIKLISKKYSKELTFSIE